MTIALLQTACNKRIDELRGLLCAYDGFHPLARDISCFYTSLEMLKVGQTVERHLDVFIETIKKEFCFVPEGYEINQTLHDVNTFLETTFYKD